MNISAMGSSGSSAMQQMQQMQSRMFAKADQDGSGGLDKAEFKSLAANGPSGASSTSDTDDVFGKLDTDRDGNLTKSELDQGAKDAMKSFRSTVNSFGSSSKASGFESDSTAPAETKTSGTDLIRQLLSQLQSTYGKSGGVETADPVSLLA